MPQEVMERLYEAIKADDRAEVDRLLRDDPGLLQDFQLTQFLETAIDFRRPEILSALIGLGLPVNFVDENGGTALMHAAWTGDTEAVRILLIAGADPDVRAEDHDSDGDPETVGLCALHFAQVKRHAAIVDLLEPATSDEVRELAKRATWSAFERKAGEPPPDPPALVELFRAIAADDPSAVRAALSGGAEAEGRDRQGTSPLWLAAAGGRVRALPVLLEAGAEVDAPGEEFGQTALTVAVRMKRFAVLAPLLAAGADPDRPDGAGMTAWDMARISPGDDSRGEALQRALEEARGRGQ